MAIYFGHNDGENVHPHNEGVGVHLFGEMGTTLFCGKFNDGTGWKCHGYITNLSTC